MANRKFGNFWVSLMLKSPLRGTLDGSTLLIRVKGRKTGREISTPVNYVRDGDVLWITSWRERSWWKNVRGGAGVGIYLKGKWVDARAETIEAPDEVLAALGHYFDLAPETAKYFGISLSADGTRDTRSMESAARDRVVVKVDIGRAGVE